MGLLQLSEEWVLMFDTSLLDEILEDATIKSEKFEPDLVDLRQPVMARPKEISIEDNNLVDIRINELEINKISSKSTLDKEITAIDSTSMTLGRIPDGLVGVVRTSIVTKKSEEKTQFLERYGPKVIKITNQNRDTLYKNFYTNIFGTPPINLSAPDNFKLLDRIRNLYERHIQSELIKKSKGAIILLDGSLIGDSIDNRKKFIDGMIASAEQNNNSLVAISKSTNLSLKHNRRSILSLLDFQEKASFVGPLNNYIEQKDSRYCGYIFVAKMSFDGPIFRVDIPKYIKEPQQIFDNLAGMSKYYGYPEELKFAHSTCIHSSIEILALQAYAIGKYNMTIEENLRNMIFAPFTTG